MTQPFILKPENARALATHFASVFTMTPEGRLFWSKKISRKNVIGKEAGSPGGRGYIAIQVGGRKYMAHKIVFAIANGFYPSGEIDHIDRDKSNNKPSNLRECTRSQNATNMGFSIRNTSTKRGVVWHKRNKKWQAQIKAGGRNVYLGQFISIDDAAAAYSEASKRFHGQFAAAELCKPSS